MAKPGKSVIRLSTPKSASLRISAGSLTVHTGHVQTLALGFFQTLGGAERPVQRQILTAVVLRDLQRVEPGVFGDQSA